MKGNQKLIGLIVGVVLSAIGAAAGLQVDEFKAGLCGAPVVASPTASPSVIPEAK